MEYKEFLFDWFYDNVTTYEQTSSDDSDEEDETMSDVQESLDDLVLK